MKTDAGDAVFLARLLASGMLPTVWVPPVATRELRALVSHRQRLVAQRTRTRNRLHSMLLRHGIELPPGVPFSAEKREWWEKLPLSPTERLQIRHHLVVLDGLTPLITEAEIELFRLSQQEPWRDQVVFLVQLPGIQVLTAMVLLAAIGDINRFTQDRLLVGYAGLGTKIHDSGETHRRGHITKRGRRELRTTMVEAAWSAVRWHPFWKAEFKRLVEVKHLNPKVATIAIARRLLVVVWHVLSKREADRQAIPEGVARKFMVWASYVRQTGQPTKTATFVRAELSRLGLPAPPEVRRSRQALTSVVTSDRQASLLIQ